MSEFSNAFAGAILAYIRSGTALPAAGALTVGLHNGDPGASGVNNDVTTTVRAAGRPGVTMGAPSNRVIANTAVVDFGAAAGAVTGQITHYSLWSGDMCIGVTPVTTARAVAAGAPVSFPVGSITVDLAFAMS